MFNRGSWIRIPVLCVMSVLFLMSFMGASAHAVNDWLVKNGTEDELVTLEIMLRASKDTTWVFETVVSGSSLKISCEETVLNEGALEPEGKSSGSLAFSECKTAINGSPSGACKPQEPFAISFQGTPFIHNGTMYELIEPKKGKPFTTITLGGPRECAIGEEFEIRGTLVNKWCDNIELFQKEHLAEIANGALFASGEHINALKFGAEPLTLSGSIFYKLTNNPKPWAFMR